MLEQELDKLKAEEKRDSEDNKLASKILDQQDQDLKYSTIYSGKHFRTAQAPPPRNDEDKEVSFRPAVLIILAE